MTIDKNTNSDVCIDLIKTEINSEIKESNITFNSISVSVIPRNVEWYDMEGFVMRKYGPFSFNFKDKFLIVAIRGDCQASIIAADGYQIKI